MPRRKEAKDEGFHIPKTRSRSLDAAEAAFLYRVNKAAAKAEPATLTTLQVTTARLMKEWYARYKRSGKLSGNPIGPGEDPAFEELQRKWLFAFKDLLCGGFTEAQVMEALRNADERLGYPMDRPHSFKFKALDIIEGRAAAWGRLELQRLEEAGAGTAIEDAARAHYKKTRMDATERVLANSKLKPRPLDPEQEADVV